MTAAPLPQKGVDVTYIIWNLCTLRYEDRCLEFYLTGGNGEVV